MHKTRRILAAGIAGLSVLLGGCGGGSGSGDTDTIAAQDVQAGALPMSIDDTETGRPLDVAVLGDGMFVAHDPVTGERVYTRYGRLELDVEGNLVHVEGWRMGGLAAGDAAGPAGANLAGREQPLPPVRWLAAPQASTKAVVNLNPPRASLDLGSVSSPIVLGSLTALQSAHWSWPWSAPPGAEEGASFMAVDAEGTPRFVQLRFGAPSADGCRLVQASVDGRSAPQQRFGAWHRLCLGDDGRLSSRSLQAPPLETAETATGLEGLALEFQLAPQMGGIGSVESIEVDGRGLGHLTQVTIDSEGALLLDYDNGVQVTHGWLLLARPETRDRFQRQGSTGWRCAGRCTTPVMVLPSQRLTGVLRSGWLATSY